MTYQINSYNGWINTTEEGYKNFNGEKRLLQADNTIPWVRVILFFTMLLSIPAVIIYTLYSIGLLFTIGVLTGIVVSCIVVWRW